MLCGSFQTKLVTFWLRHLAASLEQFHAHCCQNQALHAAAVTAAVTVAVAAAVVAALTAAVTVAVVAVLAVAVAVAAAVIAAVAVAVADYIANAVAGQAGLLSVVKQLLLQNVAVGAQPVQAKSSPQNLVTATSQWFVDLC